MSEEEQLRLHDKIERGLHESYVALLHRKAALDEDMVFADENGLPRIVPAKEALAKYLDSHRRD